MTKYFIVVSRNRDGSTPWEAEFGDYEKYCVVDEKNDLAYSNRYSGEPRREYSVKVCGDAQCAIDKFLNALNGGAL